MNVPVDSEARLARMTAGIDAIVDPDRPQRERRQARAAGVWLAAGVAGLATAGAAMYMGVGRIDRPEARVAVPSPRVAAKSFFVDMPAPVASPSAVADARAWRRPWSWQKPERRSPSDAAGRFRLTVDVPEAAVAPRPQPSLADGQEAAVPLSGEALEQALARDRERTRRINRAELDRLPQEPDAPQGN